MKKLLFLIFLSLAFNSNAAENLKPPVFVAETLDGKIFDLSKQNGKVVIINFWAYWCSDCKKETVILNELYHKYHDKNLEIIGISIDGKRARQKVLKIADSAIYPNSMFIDAKEISFKKPNNIPTTYIIDKNGKLVETLTGNGKSSLENFERILQPLLN